LTDFPGLVLPSSWVRNFKLVADRVAFGPATTPVPLKDIDCGLPGALSVILSEAVRGPILFGLNLMLIVQLPATGTLVPQLLLWLKSAKFVPTKAMPLMPNGPPMFVSVTVCMTLLVPTTWSANFSAVFESRTVACNRT
jgi:hypothetical protein